MTLIKRRKKRKKKRHKPAIQSTPAESQFVPNQRLCKPVDLATLERAEYVERIQKAGLHERRIDDSQRDGEELKVRDTYTVTRSRRLYW